MLQPTGYRNINWISVMEKMQFLSSRSLLKRKHCWNTIYLSWFFNYDIIVISYYLCTKSWYLDTF